MSARIRHGLTFANVISLIALFVALGGTGYAAIKLPKNSVTSKTIKKGAVTNAKLGKNAVSSSKVKDGSLLKQDFAANQLPAGAAGPQGPQGPAGKDGTNGTNGATGPAGTAKAFARIDGAGTLIGGVDQAKGVEQLDIQHQGGVAPAAEVTGAGVYCIGGLDFTPTSATVSLDNTDSLPAVPNLTGGSLNFIASVAIFKGEDLGRCDADHGQARVAIEQVNDATTPTLANHGFFIWLEG
jgi:hypothetical protein